MSCQMYWKPTDDDNSVQLNCCHAFSFKKKSKVSFCVVWSFDAVGINFNCVTFWQETTLLELEEFKALKQKMINQVLAVFCSKKVDQGNFKGEDQRHCLTLISYF